LTFTPAEDGVLKLTIGCEAEGVSGGDWGSSILLKPFFIQGGSPTYGDAIPVTSGRLPHFVQEDFDVVGGVSCECGLYGYITGAVALTVWNVKIAAKLYKR
jgi:hypothetical protein